MDEDAITRVVLRVPYGYKGEWIRTLFSYGEANFKRSSALYHLQDDSETSIPADRQNARDLLTLFFTVFNTFFHAF